VLGAVVLVLALGVCLSRAALIEITLLIPPHLLFRDPACDPAVGRPAKVVPAVAARCRLLPSGLIPDYIPCLGQPDDAFVVAWAMRHLLRSETKARAGSH
jgi:hypothetical protein